MSNPNTPSKIRQDSFLPFERCSLRSHPDKEGDIARAYDATQAQYFPEVKKEALLLAAECPDIPATVVAASIVTSDFSSHQWGSDSHSPRVTEICTDYSRRREEIGRESFSTRWAVNPRPVKMDIIRELMQSPMQETRQLFLAYATGRLERELRWIAGNHNGMGLTRNFGDKAAAVRDNLQYQYDFNTACVSPLLGTTGLPGLEARYASRLEKIEAALGGREKAVAGKGRKLAPDAGYEDAYIPRRPFENHPLGWKSRWLRAEI
jgi:hypothetical protein